MVKLKLYKGCISKFWINEDVDILSKNAAISVVVNIIIIQIVVNFMESENISFDAREVT